MSIVIAEKSKRGRKKKVVEVINQSNIDNTTEPVKPVPKKRGRKPKGGKIIPQNNIIEHKHEIEPNVILHLKCSLKDINDLDNKYNDELVQSFNFDNNNNNNTNNDFLLNTEQESKYDSDSEECTNEHNKTKLLWKKLNTIKVNLHKNDISDKRSACFWCTYDFDNPPIFIPKCEFKDTYQVYGCFCSPQCGVAYLMNEKIDTSIKFERYQLLNHVYGKIYNYSKTINPAPNPYYLLDKFYGNLTIKEYRNLFNSEQLLIVVEKPLSHIFPELYEDNTDFILNKKTISSSSSIKIKRKNNSTNKTSILDNFGMNKN